MVDPGLATDRTALAWQRTALATAAGSAIMARLTFDRLGPPALVTMAAALLLSGWILLESRGRYRHDAGLRQRGRPRGGRAPLALAVAVALITLTELIALTGGTAG